MAPQASKPSPGISAYSYQQGPNKTPLRPGDPVILPRWVRDVVKSTPRIDVNYRNLVTRGIILSKDSVIVSSLEQATDYMQGTMPIHTWEAPAPLLYVRPTDVSVAYGSAKPPILDYTTSTLSHEIKVLPDHLQLAQSLADTIISIVPDDVDRQAYEEDCDGNGLKLLTTIFQEMHDAIDSDAGDAIEAIILAVCNQGPPSLQVSVVKSYFAEIEDWNE